MSETLYAARFSRRDVLKLAAAGLLLAGCRQSQQPEAALALVNGTLIDGTGAGPLPDAALVVQGKQIGSVGLRARVKIPAHAQVVDVGGATILPGLINAHVHDAYEESTLKAWAQGGVTTVQDLGNSGPRGQLFVFRDQARDKPQGARLVAAGPMVTVPGGYPIVPWGGGGLTVASADDARRQVEQLLDDGADLIKIALESGVIFRQEIPMLSPEQAEAVVEVAHRRGALVAAHVTVSQDVERALAAGVDTMAHMATDDVPDALIARMIEANAYWIPTLELWAGVSSRTAVGFDAQAVSNLQRYAVAGGKVALGTDYGGYTTPFQLGMPIREIELMQQAGMAPLQIIVAATRNAAHVCNRERELGTLEVNKVADVLVVDGNPVEDLHALTRVKLVLRDGVVIRQ